MKPPRHSPDRELQNTPEAFASQLREGQYNELRVALFYQLRGFHTRIGFCNGRYDISLLRTGHEVRRVEVKWDKRGGETGNLYFEVENTRQKTASGIMATTADVWCHVLGSGERALLAPVEGLREFLGRGGFRSVNTVGADSNSRGLLVPLDSTSAIEKARWVRLPTIEEYFGEIFRRGTAPG